MQVNGTTYYYVTNLQGDVMGLVDTSGNSVASYTYDPYGKPLTATGELADKNPLRYRGYYYDSESGLYYLQSRYYDPATRRFINADSYASTGQGLIGHNMFAYCLNSPTMLADRGGLLLTVLVLLDLYAFDRFRKARITYEWTPAAVRLHGKWLEREIAFREGVCVSGMKLRLPSRFHYWRRESFLVLWKPGERTVDPETLPIFLLARKGVVLLPDTPELRAKLRETLGQDVPEFPQVCTARAE